MGRYWNRSAWVTAAVTTSGVWLSPAVFSFGLKRRRSLSPQSLTRQRYSWRAGAFTDDRARLWAVEGANGAGRPLAQRLVEAGERVVDVPAKLAARVRLFRHRP